MQVERQSRECEPRRPRPQAPPSQNDRTRPWSSTSRLTLSPSLPWACRLHAELAMTDEYDVRQPRHHVSSSNAPVDPKRSARLELNVVCLLENYGTAEDRAEVHFSCTPRKKRSADA